MKKKPSYIDYIAIVIAITATVELDLFQSLRENFLFYLFCNAIFSSLLGIIIILIGNKIQSYLMNRRQRP